MFGMLLGHYRGPCGERFRINSRLLREERSFGASGMGHKYKDRFEKSLIRIIQVGTKTNASGRTFFASAHVKQRKLSHFDSTCV